MTKYREEIEQGEAAFANDCPRSDNPHAYLSTEWYAWDAGWGNANEIRKWETEWPALRDCPRA